MADALEKSILDGSFFRGPRTPSPTRSASTGSPAGSDDERGGREDDGDGERDGLDDEGITAPAGTTAQSSRRPKQGSSNTGPKGVRADRDAHNIAQKEMYRQRIQETNAQLQKMALLGATSEEQEELIKAQAILKHQLKEEEARDRGSKSDQEEDDDEDREVMQRYRQARLAQMRREQQQSNSSGHRFGHLIEIHDDKQYLDAIEAEEDNDDVAVIVHIYSKVSQSAAAAAAVTFIVLSLTPLLIIFSRTYKDAAN